MEHLDEVRQLTSVLARKFKVWRRSVIAMTLRAAKQGFFDRDKVKRSVDAGTRRVLSKFGAFVRTRAKTSKAPS